MENIEEYVKSWSECVNVLSDLFEEHKNNPYALNKMSAYVGNLTSFINKTLKEKDEKDKEREKINKEKDIFITKFLKTHNYFYCQNYNSSYIQYYIFQNNLLLKIYHLKNILVKNFLY